MFRRLRGSAELQANSSAEAIRQACDELQESVEQGTLGDIVAKLEKLVLRYYSDVLLQANQSFFSARRVAWVGFAVLAVTLAYTLVFDALARFGILEPASDNSMTVEKVGIVSAVLVEFIAGINFWLYSRGARQFSAFHICLERTHRYLLAYKIADQMESDRDATFRNISCIMASAPMIGQFEIKGSLHEPIVLPVQSGSGTPGGVV
jgi:hypothetical protein